MNSLLEMKQTAMTTLDFVVIGAGKCGTTALANLLDCHPGIYMSDPKEPNFFSDDDEYARGIPYYLRLFSGAENYQLRGEASGRYTALEKYPRTAERIFRHFPACKLIYLVREPFSRIESLWMENASQGISWVLPFDASIRDQRDIYVGSTNYLKQIDHYRQFFPDEQILILFYEDLFSADDTELRRCYRFLSVDPAASTGSAGDMVNASQGKSIDAPLLLKLRSLPAFNSLKGMVPRGLKQAVKSALPRRSIDSRPEWRADTRRLVADSLGDDLRAFLHRYGKPAEFWGLA